VEPGRNSLETAHRIARLAKDIGLENIAVVGNKVHNQKEREFITSGLTGFELLGFIPYDQTMMDADVSGKSLVNASPSITSAVNDIYQKLMIAVKT
jgi:CO dehydrogenase maturation factor